MAHITLSADLAGQVIEVRPFEIGKPLLKWSPVDPDKKGSYYDEYALIQLDHRGPYATTVGVRFYLYRKIRRYPELIGIVTLVNNSTVFPIPGPFDELQVKCDSLGPSTDQVQVSMVSRREVERDSYK